MSEQNEGELSKRILNVRFRFREDCDGIPLREVSANHKINEILDEANQEIMVKLEKAPFNIDGFFVAGAVRGYQLEKWRDEFHILLLKWLGSASEKQPK